MKRRLGDRRGRPRFEIVGALWGTLDAAIEMLLINVAREGVLVQSPVALAPESVHNVTLICEGQPMATTVRVRHLRQVTGPGGRHYLIGLMFLSMPPPLRAQIDAWMDDGAHVITYST